MGMYIYIYEKPGGGKKKEREREMERELSCPYSNQLCNPNNHQKLTFASYKILYPISLAINAQFVYLSKMHHILKAMLAFSRGIHIPSLIWKYQ